MAGNRDETRDLAALSGAALLDHYLTSVQEQLKSVLKGSKLLDGYSRSKLTIDMNQLRTIIGHTSSNKETSRFLVKWINKLIKQLHRPHEYRPLTLTCIRKVQESINWAIHGHFSIKEEIQDTSLLTVLQNVRVLKGKNLIPESVKKIIDGSEDD